MRSPHIPLLPDVSFPLCVSVVKANILLRQDKFDRPFLLFLPTVDHLQSSLMFVLQLAKIGAATPPGGWSPPPGPSVVDGWRRDERTRDTPQSLPRALVSSAKPTTGVQVVRPAAPPLPRLAHSRCPQSGATPPQATLVRLAPFAREACARVRYPQRRLCLRQVGIDPPFIFDPPSL